MKHKIAVTLLAGLSLGSCGPGLGDGTEPIGHGYFLHDSGGNGRSIMFHEHGQPPKWVIDIRVDEYFTRGDTIVASRRPMSAVMTSGGYLAWQEPGECEYWVIDMKTHAVRITVEEKEYGSLRCRQ